MKTTRTPKDHCASCGEKIDAASEMKGEKRPSPGDFSICFYCGHLTMFDDNLRHRQMTLKELQEATTDPRVIELQKALQGFARLAILKRGPR